MSQDGLTVAVAAIYSDYGSDVDRWEDWKEDDLGFRTIEESGQEGWYDWEVQDWVDWELDFADPCIYARAWDGWCPDGDNCTDLHIHSDGTWVSPFTNEEWEQARQQYPELEDETIVGHAGTWSAQINDGIDEPNYWDDLTEEGEDWAYVEPQASICDADAE